MTKDAFFLLLGYGTIFAITGTTMDDELESLRHLGMRHAHERLFALISKGKRDKSK